MKVAPLDLDDVDQDSDDILPFRAHEPRNGGPENVVRHLGALRDFLLDGHHRTPLATCTFDPLEKFPYFLREDASTLEKRSAYYFSRFYESYEGALINLVN